MPTDHKDDASGQSKRGSERQSEIGEQAGAPSRPDEGKPPVSRKRRRYVTRRNAILLGILIAAGFIVFVFVLLLAYRLGFVDRYVAGQIKDTLAKYGIRAEIRDFHTALSPQTVEMLGLELYDAKTGKKLGKVDRLLATVRIEDLYALNLHRDINLK